MQIKASIKNVRIGPRKVRLLTQDWRGKHPEAVITRLTLQPYKSAEVLIKLLKQAIANAVSVHKRENATLSVDTIQVGDAFGFKRMDRSHGARFDRGMIKKRGSNVYLTLASAEPTKAKSPQTVQASEKKVTNIAKKHGAKS